MDFDNLRDKLLVSLNRADSWDINGTGNFILKMKSTVPFVAVLTRV